MEIIIKKKNIELTKETEDFIQQKISSLEKFIKTIYNEKHFDHLSEKGEPEIEAVVEIGKETLHHKKGPYFKAECHIRLPGRDIMASAEDYNLLQAIDDVKKELKIEINKYKEKFVAMAKRGTRAFKKDLKMSPEARFYRKGRIREEGI